MTELPKLLIYISHKSIILFKNYTVDQMARQTC